MSASKFFHGGVPGLRVGDVIEPGHERRSHDGCPWCEARSRGEAHLGLDPLAPEGWVYATEDRLYAKHYASLWGRGDLYRVEPNGPFEVSTEDSIPSVRARAWTVRAVIDRAVLLTDSERRRLQREWTSADMRRAS